MTNGREKYNKFVRRYLDSHPGSKLPDAAAEWRKKTGKPPQRKKRKVPKDPVDSIPAPPKPVEVPGVVIQNWMEVPSGGLILKLVSNGEHRNLGTLRITEEGVTYSRPNSKKKSEDLRRLGFGILASLSETGLE